MTIQEQVEALVRDVDEIRANVGLTDDEKSEQIKAVEAKIHEVRPDPARHVGSGSMGGGVSPAKLTGEVRKAVITKLERRLDDPQWAHKKEHYVKVLKNIKA